MIDEEDEQRIDRALDGRLSPEAWQQLQADVIADPELRAAYAERAWLHGQLRAERHLLPKLLVDDGTRQPGAEAKTRRSRWAPMAGVAVAAALVTALLILTMTRRQPSFEPVATLIEAAGCQWEGSDLPTAQGAKLGTGTLALARGMATLEFESGATVTLEAPTTLEVLTGMRCRLVEGSVVAEVPESAHGFTINTAEIEVIDLGTRFGVTANAFGNSQVHVFDGEVEVGRTGQEPKRLTTGTGIHAGGRTPLPDREIARETAPETSRLGWTAIPTSLGRGKDAFARRGDEHGPTGAHPLVMVKHTDRVATNERRAYLSFDVAAAREEGFSAAELVLDVEPSGLGFSALVPDSRFAVYGLTDDELDSWDESALVWDTAPASNEDGLDPGRVRKLGSFEIRRGAAVLQVAVATEELAEFARRDGNGLVTLVILRETGENDPQGLVHAFASKEHPRARPPTLWLKTDRSPEKETPQGK